ncbi:helix-turn-helix domain-containing protein [Lysinibacillus sphaericus]|uniref:Helix-turn-helix domain-containing protein n=1 Tax=Lysinibacillus sphaericus OT4b.31 TaxID=1285586 RepID=R7ZCB9_LYSSH|nr:helix-turn-helix domain-containing protein [Lysinibacillus sphaericus]EON71800.1 hypothetical protein H131_14993 [Lysinibacillus sphaericus OT4b.31]
MELYTIKEVAGRLKTNPNTVYTLINAGLIRPLKLGRLKVSEAELVSFINRNTGMDITDPFNPKVIDIATEVGKGTEISV